MIPYIHQVQIRNYKSLDQVVVNLEPFTALVGPNGAGKSNFIDALAFVKDCLSESIEMALKRRGGITAVRRYRGKGFPPRQMEFIFHLVLKNDLKAQFSFAIAAQSPRKFRVAKEYCSLQAKNRSYNYEVRDSKFIKPIHGINPKLKPDHLALFVASATEEFQPVYEFLTSMRCYAIAPIRLRELQDPDPGDYLQRDGSNAAAVLKRLKEAEGNGDRYERLCRLLAAVTEGITKIDYWPVGPKETIGFKQEIGSARSLDFGALNMSDGTLRALGVLLAVYQAGQHSLIAIEEPEATVHPAATEVIVEVLLDAARQRQVLITTHSPDLLDKKDIQEGQLRVVSMEKGKTLISPLSPASREAIRKRLYTPGELLRIDELNADLKSGTV